MTSRIIIINCSRFLFLIIFQVLILNNINLGGYINPFFYIYFILLLPFSVSRWMLLASAFLLGLVIDVFTNTPGLNASACVAMAFARPFVIRIISTGSESPIGINPTIKNQGIKWFLYYAIILIFVHHFILFYLEIFRFHEFFQTLFRTLISSAITLVFVLISEYLFFQKSK